MTYRLTTLALLAALLAPTALACGISEEDVDAKLAPLTAQMDELRGEMEDLRTNVNTRMDATERNIAQAVEDRLVEFDARYTAYNENAERLGGLANQITTIVDRNKAVYQQLFTLLQRQQDTLQFDQQMLGERADYLRFEVNQLAALLDSLRQQGGDPNDSE